MKVLILATSVLATVTAILGVTVLTATLGEETDSVINNNIVSSKTEFDVAYTFAALEREFVLGEC